MRDQAIEGHPEITRRSEADPHAAEHSGGLLAIAIFKLAKSIFFFCVGLGLFHLLHRDLSEAAQRLATALHFEPEWRITALLTEKITLLDPKKLRDLGFFAFAYSAIAMTEGVGLFLEKVWAEYLTLSLTVMFLPWEIYELVRRPDWIRLGLLVINLVVLAYLLWILDRKKKTAG
jgi:uncharacterized membrane protein (DUF2068 family)